VEEGREWRPTWKEEGPPRTAASIGERKLPPTKARASPQHRQPRRQAAPEGGTGRSNVVTKIIFDRSFSVVLQLWGVRYKLGI
jgi:hypothetical protein